MPKYSDKQFQDKAREVYEHDGELEIDNDAVVSREDDDSVGAYVQAWVWIQFEEED